MFRHRNRCTAPLRGMLPSRLGLLRLLLVPWLVESSLHRIPLIRGDPTLDRLSGTITILLIINSVADQLGSDGRKHPLDKLGPVWCIEKHILEERKPNIYQLYIICKNYMIHVKSKYILTLKHANQ
ncbi:hypothetical protein M6B38_202080 [Iris pallida]|uniref:Secreted protein n=1 Tax=Iris pallida TaxID=29817 RepID=A0AAX6E9Y9_IRIPA|nr:hypothetical protein M6B38_202080 [Iris pallida]